MDTTPQNKDSDSEVDFQFKVQVVVKLITMLLLVGTILTVYFRVAALNQLIQQVDYCILAFLVVVALVFYLIDVWQRSAKAGFMLARWGWPVAYTAASLLLTYKYF